MHTSAAQTRMLRGRNGLKNRGSYVVLGWIRQKQALPLRLFSLAQPLSVYTSIQKHILLY
jgi:hypothetical protein